ncbi:MAG: arginine repressor [Tractidigestivibacter sp.]|uniref:arginine repressor n=1 Tax=Tractidigestivibacter sp. TaxID=2847320 RepID=UPI003D8B6561
MAKQRNDRQEAIRRIIRSQSIRTQRALVDALQEEGFSCTQATVSRDITEMGLRKLPEGIYVLSEDLHLQRMLSEFVVEVNRANNLVVVKCQPGTASGVAAAIDGGELANTLGSVAGNDTVLIICSADEGAESLQDLIAKLASSR